MILDGLFGTLTKIAEVFHPRLSAAPGTRAAGAVTYAVHYYAAPRTLFNVQPGSFYPPPKVTSAVIQLPLHEAPPVTPRSAEAMFLSLIHIAYENVAFARRVTNIPERQIKRRVPYVLNLVGLAGKAHSLPQELSGGEQQRIASLLEIKVQRKASKKCLIW